MPVQPPTAASAAELSLEPGWLHGVALPVPDGELPWPGGTWGGLEARTQPCPSIRHPARMGGDTGAQEGG